MVVYHKLTAVPNAHLTRSRILKELIAQTTLTVKSHQNKFPQI